MKPLVLIMCVLSLTGCTALQSKLDAIAARSTPGARLFGGLGWFFLGMTGAAVAMTVTIWITYLYADRLTRMMGPTGTRTITRMSAFLLLCIGVQILITGVEDVLGPLLAGR